MECRTKDFCQSGYSLEQKQHEGVHVADDEEEDAAEDEEEEEEEVDEEEEEEEEEEEAMDDDEDEQVEDEDEDDEDEDDEDHVDQEHQNYEQDFELEQRDERVGVTGNLSNGLASLKAGLVSKGDPKLQHAAQTEGPQQQQQQQQVGVDVRPCIRDDWTEPATHALLNAWGEKYVQLNKGNLKQEDWAEVAVVVSSICKIHKTGVQCKNRLDTLKKKYKVEKQKQYVIGSSDSKWPFYKQLDKLVSATSKQAGIPGAVDAGQPVKFSAVERSRGENLKGARKFAVGEPGGAPNNASTCSRSKESPDMTYSSPQNALGLDGTRKRKSIDAPFKTLAKAISKFGEIYEKMEYSKQKQLMDLEKIRMEFTRDLELQRMQLFMQTQVELAKMKYGGNDVEATISNFSG